MLKRLAACALLGVLLSGAAHGHGVPPVIVPPIVVPPPAPVTPAAMPAASSSWYTWQIKLMQAGLAGIVIFVGYCMATEDPDYCERQESEHAWPD